MTIKLAVLQSGDQIIADVSEVVSEDKQPQRHLRLLDHLIVEQQV